MNFLCFRGGREKIQGVSTDEATRKSTCTYILEEFAIFDFYAYYVSVCVKFDYFFLTKKAYP